MANLVPVMTSNTAPSGVASASFSDGGTFAYQAFDHNVNNNFSSNQDSWLKYQFTGKKSITGYSVLSHTYSGYAVKSWLFQGSNNGTIWTTLDSQTNQDTRSRKEYSVSGVNHYSYIRLSNMVSSSGDTLIVKEFEILGTEILIPRVVNYWSI